MYILFMILYYLAMPSYSVTGLLLQRTHTLKGPFQCLLLFLVLYCKPLTAFLALCVLVELLVNSVVERVYNTVTPA